MQEQLSGGQEASGWQFTPEDMQHPEQQQNGHHNSGEDLMVQWTASEFLAHHKSAGWYTVLALGALGGAGLIYLLTHDPITTGVILAAAAVLGFAASRKPRTLQYRIDSQGIHIDAKLYPFSNYKAFSVIDEGAVNSIRLAPLRRFMPPLSMYYAPQDEDKIVGAISSMLPYEEKDDDIVDRMMRNIRF